MANIPAPLYPITEYDVFRRMPDLGFLDPADITFNQHKAKMLAFAGSKDPGQVWLDFFKHADGELVLEWVAGISALTQYNNLTGIREKGLDTAITLSGVTETAFNKGYLIPPGVGGKLRLTVSREGTPLTVLKGTIIGQLSTYFIIANESKTITSTDTIDCCVGYQDVIAQSVPGVPSFKKYVFKPAGKYVAIEQEAFTVDNESIELAITHSPDRQVSNNYLLRRYTGGMIIIYSGNGVVGFSKPSATNISYTCISYDDDLSDKMTGTPQLDLALILEGWTVLTMPSNTLTREEVRSSATFHSPDGRLVTDTDYSSFITQNFGGLIYDVVSYNTDPDQEIIILKQPNFGTGTEETNNLISITQRLDARRGMGIKINLYLKEPDQGITWKPIFYVDEKLLTPALQNSVDQFLTSRTMKMFRQAATINAAELASELSSLFKVKMVADNVNESVTVPFLGYFTSFTAQLSIRSSTKVVTNGG